VLLALLLATGLRFYRLDAQSFWNDEGNTARLVERPVPLIIAGAAGDIHPPGYYLLLHGWRSLAGESEFALRAYSALCGVLTVAAAAAVGRRAGGWLTALSAALLVAIHPLSVYYSQEARMYAQLGLVSALTLFLGVKLVKRQTSNVKRQALYFMDDFLLALCIAAGLYTQYAYVFALFGLNVAFGLYWLISRPRNWPLLGHWVGTHALGGLLFAPWAPIALRASSWRPPDLDQGQALHALARTLLGGITLPTDKGAYLIPIAGALLLWALLTRPKNAFVKWAALGMALVPAALIFALGVYRPAYLKFLNVSVAPLAVCLALPLGRTRRGGEGERGRQGDKVTRRQEVSRFPVSYFLFPISFCLFLALLPAQITALRHLYTDPAYARDDYRGLAAQITAESRPGDAVLLSAPNQWEVFTYYYRGPAPVYPAPYHPADGEASAWVSDTLRPHTRLFAVFWGDGESDPTRAVEIALAQQAYKATEQWWGDLRFARYGLAAQDVATTTVDVILGNAIRLNGFAIPPRIYAPGDIVPVLVEWQAVTPIPQRYKVFLHGVDAAGQLVMQNDMEPLTGSAPTDRWQPGSPLTDRYGLYLPSNIPAGTYTLLIGMYDYSGARLLITQDGQAVGDALSLGEVRVANSE